MKNLFFLGKYINEANIKQLIAKQEDEIQFSFRDFSTHSKSTKNYTRYFRPFQTIKSYKSFLCNNSKQFENKWKSHKPFFLFSKSLQI